MKIKALAMTVAGLAIAAPFSNADTLDPETLTVTGKIYQAGPDAKKPIITSTLTVKRLLAIFGHPEVKPSEAKFFYDEDTNADVLANAAGTTVYGTFFAYQPNPTTLDGQPGAGDEAGATTMLSGALQGTYFGSFRSAAHASKGSNAFYAYGMIGAVKTIIKGSFSYSQPFAPQ